MRITAFGRTLTARKWVLEPVCVVSQRCLETRIGLGWDPELAISVEAQRELEPGVPLVKYRGVSFDRVRRRFNAMIRVEGRLRKLGKFLDPDEAARAYNRALRALNNPDRQGFNVLEPMF